MRLAPMSPIIDPNEGFTPENDLFGYSVFGDRLSKLVSSVDQPLTLLIDGPWGSGKSTFVKQWAGLLRKTGACVIEFDAFANDHHEDAFVALSAEIIAVAKREFGEQEPVVSSIYDCAKKVGVALLPVAGRIAVKALTAGALSEDDVKSFGSVAVSAFEQTGNAIAEAAEREIAERLSSAQNERYILNRFRETLEQLAENIAEKNSPEETDVECSESNNVPVIIIIDELDRCKPTFSLNILERIKHLFSVNGVVFVLVSNMIQLKASVEGAYGSNTDGLLYLEKFYDLRVTLPIDRLDRASSSERYVFFLWESMGLNISEGAIDETIKRQIIIISEIYGISLRTIERIAAHAALAYAATSGNTLRLAPLIAGLAVIRQIRPDIYQKAREGRMTWRDAKDFFKFDEWPDQIRNRSEGWWRFFTDHSMKNEEMIDYSQVFVRYGFENRLSLVKWGASLIDGLSLPE